MATELPKFQELSHLPEQDRLRLLDEFIRELGTYYETAPRFEAREFQMVNNGTASVQVDYPPRGVILLDVIEQDDPSAMLDEHWPRTWLYQVDEAGAGQIVFTDTSSPPGYVGTPFGLATDTIYTIRILVVR